MVSIRELHEKYAVDFLSMLLQLDQETDNMMYEPGERPKDANSIKSIIKNNKQTDSITFLVFEEKKCVGFLSANRDIFKRIRHVAYVVIGILKENCGKGIGTSLFIEMEKWAKNNGITRLELTVMVRNQAAVNLYKKNGFEIEGVRKHSMIVNGEYVDEYYMSKLL